jgi:hypothetical protein
MLSFFQFDVSSFSSLAVVSCSDRKLSEGENEATTGAAQHFK